MRTEHSRALVLATRVTGASVSQLERRLDNTVVGISVDAEMPHGELTTRVLLTTLRRGPGHLVLIGDGIPARVVDALQAACANIDPTRPLRVERTIPDNLTTRVHIGPSVPGQAIRVVPDGYGAHVAGARTAVIWPARAGNALGAIYAAALGASEVFKHTARTVTGRRVVHRHLRFCPVTLSTDLTRSPTLQGPIPLELALIGIGAIGTGIVLILSELDTAGTILAVDRQRYALENRGTYSLGGTAETQTAPWKVDLARQALPRFDVIPFPEPVDALVKAIDSGRAPWLPLVLTALDSAEARRNPQRLWPDRLIDAATGDTMLGLCDHRYGVDPCMMCVFPVRRDEPSGAERVAEQLGLSVDLLASADTVLTAQHLVGLTDSQRRRLTPHLGKPVCGLARATGLTDLDADGFMPSIPFVSLQAACLSVGRLLAACLDLKAPGNFVQYDSLIGPQAASIETMRKRESCLCTTRASTIEKVRAARAIAAPRTPAATFSPRSQPASRKL